MKVMQCLSCGAPLNVTPGQRYVPCEFCGSTVDVGSRTVLPRGATNLGAAPGAYARAPYPQGRGAGGAKPAIVLMVALGMVISMAGVGVALFFTASSAPTRPPTSVPGGGTRLPAMPSLPSVSKANYFNDASPILGQIKAKFGPRLLIKELVVYDEYVIFTAQNPAKPDNLDSYTLRNGSIDEGRPQSFVGDRRKLEAQLFSIDAIPFGSLASLGRDALGRFQAAGVAEGKVTHIIIEREDFGRGQNVILRPYVSSERRGGGYVEYDARGGLKRMVGPS